MKNQTQTPSFFVADFSFLIDEVEPPTQRMTPREEPTQPQARPMPKPQAERAVPSGVFTPARLGALIDRESTIRLGGMNGPGQALLSAAKFGLKCVMNAPKPYDDTAKKALLAEITYRAQCAFELKPGVTDAKAEAETWLESATIEVEAALAKSAPKPAEVVVAKPAPKPTQASAPVEKPAPLNKFSVDAVRELFRLTGEPNKLAGNLMARIEATMERYTPAEITALHEAIEIAASAGAAMLNAQKLSAAAPTKRFTRPEPAKGAPVYKKTMPTASPSDEIVSSKPVATPTTRAAAPKKSVSAEEARRIEAAKDEARSRFYSDPFAVSAKAPKLKPAKEGKKDKKNKKAQAAQAQATQ